MKYPAIIKNALLSVITFGIAQSALAVTDEEFNALKEQFNQLADQVDDNSKNSSSATTVGGVGLSAVMIACARGAKVIAVDIDTSALDFAKKIGAAALVDASQSEDVVERIRELTGRGAHVSIDALGSAITCANSISCLRKHGRHIQVGLLAGDDYRPRLPMELLIGRELEIIGSHGMQAARYGDMLEMIMSGLLDPQRLIGKTVPLEDAPRELEAMSHFGTVGITVIDRFS